MGKMVGRVATLSVFLTGMLRHGRVTLCLCAPVNALSLFVDSLHVKARGRLALEWRGMHMPLCVLGRDVVPAEQKIA